MIVFVIRRYNDIDHLAPIIYKIKKDSDRKIMVLCQNPYYDIYNDSRLNFLRDKCGVTIKYALEAYRPAFMHKVLSFIVCGQFSLNADKKLSVLNFLSVIAARVYLKLKIVIFENLVADKYFGEQWAGEFYKKERVSAVIFDFAKERQYMTRALFNAAKKMGVTTVAIPPGAMMYSDRLSKTRSFDNYELPDYDFLVMQHELRKKLTISIGGPADRMVTLGIPRFCAEWEKILQDITPVSISKSRRGKGHLNVLYIDRPIGEGMDEKKLIGTIRAIAGLYYVRLIIKPHTRNNRLYSGELSEYAEIVPDIDSVELIRWADVVIGTTSSILLEALIQKKILLFPKYLFDHLLLIEEMKACRVIKSRQELVSALEDISGGDDRKPYQDEDVDALLARVIYDGDSTRDVLKGYMDFILGNERHGSQGDVPAYKDV